MHTLADAIQQELQNSSDQLTWRLETYKKMSNWVTENLEKFDTDHEWFTTRMYANADSFTVYAYTREELAALMKLAPRWEKEKDDYNGSINYIAEIFEAAGKYSGEPFQYTFKIIAKQNALPPTCRTVEYEEVVPAQPQKTYKRTRIVCDFATNRN